MTPTGEPRMTGGLTYDRRITTGNLLTVAVYIIAMVVAGAMLNQRVSGVESATTNLQAWEASTNGTVSSIETRLTTVEANQRNGADRSAQTQATLKDMQAQLSLVLQQTAAINAILKGRADP